jgi:hypothetical protein
MSATGPQRGARFIAVMAAVAARLPFGLNRVVSARLVGFAVISSITFPVDLALLTAFHSGLRWPLPAGITAAYALASGLGYVLNRSLNFRSHGAVGPQLTVYTAVVTAATQRANFADSRRHYGAGSGSRQRAPDGSAASSARAQSR